MRNSAMAAAASLLFLIVLFPGSLQLKLQGPKLARGVDVPVRLECSGDPGDYMESGIYWFHQTATTPQSIMFLNVLGKSSYNPKIDDSRFKAEKTGSRYTLTITPFLEKDQGTYYCLINRNSLLIFSSGLPLFYPQVTTPKPTTTKPPTPAAPSATSSSDGCSCTPDKKDQKGINCELHVWAPLTGLCGFLFLCLVVAFILLCSRTRRRRCRCKHKPLEERNGKMTPYQKR